MNLDDLMRLEGIEDYNIWWYGVGIDADYINDKGFKKEWLDVRKGADTEKGRIYIILVGLNGYKTKYMHAIRLTAKKDETLYSWEKVPIGIDKYSDRLVFKCNRKFSFYNSKACGKDFEVDYIRPIEENRTVEQFRDYENVELSFKELKEVIENEYSDYYKPFTCIKAVYMIIDGNTGKQYVGSAYDNNESLWARWRSYATTYHGNNQQLKELYKQYGNDYFLKFKYIILRVFPMSISNKEIIDAESWYKERFMTREFGLNSN